MKFRILGPLEVEGERGAVPVAGTRPRAILAVLLLHPNRPVSTDRLAIALWGTEAPAGAVKAVQMSVSRLRKALGGEDVIIETTLAGYRLHVEPEDIDAERFARMVSEGRQQLDAGDTVRAAATFHRALRLWRGPALADLEFEPFAQSEILRLEEQRLSALELRVEADLRAGRHAEFIAELQRLVATHPTRERLAAHLMLALYRSGRQSDALEAYRAARLGLLEEIGVEPGRELQGLHQAILAQESSLVAEPERALALAAVAPEDPPAPATADPAAIDGAGPQTGADRRIVTVLVGRLSARVDPEARRRLLKEAAEEAATIVKDHHEGSFLTGLDGDVVGIFGAPLSHENDALRALRAADELRARVAALSTERLPGLTIRIGIDTGEVISDTSERPFQTGEPITGGADLARIAGAGEVLLTDATRRLVADAILAEPAPDGSGWRLLGLVEGADGVSRWLAAPIVGRDRDLQAVRAAMELAEREQATHLLTVLGDPGVGKTRLAHEIATELADRVTVLEGHCLSYGDSNGLWPLREALVHEAGAATREAIRVLLDNAEDADRIADVVAAALDLTTATPAATEVPWAFRKLIESVARRRPVLLIVDDVHWAEPPLLDLIDHLVEWLTTAPVLVLCLARPELLETHPQSGGGNDRIASHKLKPLRDDHSLQLLVNHRDATSLETRERHEILRTAEGNPLFIEQLLAMHAEDPEWRAGSPVPPTVRGLLAARLDRLNHGERTLINRAAVLGREFGVSALLDPLPAEARLSANQDLSGLVHRGLVRPIRSALGGEDRLTFHHVLIRNAAYRATPKAVRCRLHEEFARWFEQRGGEHDEIIGFHLEQAFGYRLELDSLDNATRKLAADAAERLVAARRRAMLRGDAHAEAKLLQRAADLLDRSEQRKPEVLLHLGVTLMDTGRFAEAEPMLEAADRLGDEALKARASIELSNYRLLVDPDAAIERMLAIAENSIKVFTDEGDDAGLARALTHRGLLRWGRCECAAAADEFEQALRHSPQSDRTHDRQDILDLLARATVLGPRTVDDGIVRLQEIQRVADGDLVVLAVVDTMLAVMEAMRSRIDVARDLYGKARERLRGLDLKVRLAGLEMWIARAELTAGEARLSESGLEEAFVVLEQAHEGVRLPTVAAYLARVYYEQQKLQEAENFTRIAEERSWERDAATKALWKSTRALIIVARRGDADHAEELAREAVTLARNTDMVPILAEAVTDLAQVLLARHRDAEALDAIDEALVLHERKQNRASAEKAVALRAMIHAGVAS